MSVEQYRAKRKLPNFYSYTDSDEEVEETFSDASSEGEEIYCLCKRKSEGLMIQCDECSDWYHAKCVGFRSKTTPKKYVCGICKQDDNTVAQLIMLLSNYQQVITQQLSDNDAYDSDYQKSSENERSSSLPNSPVSSPSSSPASPSLNNEQKYTITHVTTHSPSDISRLLNNQSKPNFLYANVIHPDNDSEMTSASGSGRSRKRKSEIQMAILMRYYEQNPDPDLSLKKRIAEETTLTVKQVSDWFYNLRVRKRFKTR